MPDGHTKLDEAWDAAFAHPGTSIPIGRTVICDGCSEDWTDRPETGGFVFMSKAICPDCAPRWLRGIKQYDEEHFIRARCLGGESFADFVRAYRGPDAAVRVTYGEPSK